MYRPEIKVVDCTIRDGGLMNNSQFPLELVKDVYKSVAESGVDIIELGYRNSKKMFDPAKYGPWRFCDEADLRSVVEGVDSDIQVAVMMDAHKSDYNDLLPKSESVVDMVRIATYVKDIDKAIAISNNASKKGYVTGINIMAISHVIERELEEALAQIENETDAAVCYIVDSFGALYSEDIDYLVEKYRSRIKTKEIGIHCHNHKQLAFSNTIQGIIRGANYLDATLYGLGRAAGNCPLELLLGFLKNPKFDVRPILGVIGKHILPMHKELQWGYSVPYMIAGMFNTHPTKAMELMNLPDDDARKSDFITFYNETVAEESIS